MRFPRALSWAVPLAVGAGLLSLGIGRPWTCSYDANGALFSTVARNYLRYGLVATRGGQVVNGGLAAATPHLYVFHVVDLPLPPELAANPPGVACTAPSPFYFYTHHPPGLPLTIAVSFALFGVHEWSARLVAILFTLGAAGALYLVARELAAGRSQRDAGGTADGRGAWAGFFAALLFAVQPMVAFYGRMPDHEAPGAFFIVILTLLYLRWRRDGRRRWIAAMCVAAFVGVWCAWIVFVVPWVLLAHVFSCRRSPFGMGLWEAPASPPACSQTQAGACGSRVERGAAGGSEEKQGIPSRRCGTFGREDARWAAALGWVVAAGAIGFLSVLGHIALIEGGLGELWRALTHRLSTEATDRGGARTFTFMALLVRQYEYFITAFSVSLLAPCAAWVLGLGRRTREAALLIVALMVIAAFNVLGFRQGAYIHLYYQFYLAIPLALAGGLALGALVGLSVRRRGLGAVAMLVAAVVAVEGAERWAAIRGVVIPEYAEQIVLAGPVREATRPEDCVDITWDQRTSLRQLTYYADRDLGPTAHDVIRGDLGVGHPYTVLVRVGADPSRPEIKRYFRQGRRLD